MNKYIVLHPDTFLWYDETQGLFYNSESFSFLHFECTPLLLKYCERINDFDNMYAVAIDADDENNPIFSKWINSIVDKHIGHIVPLSLDGKKPFSFPPILNLQHEIEERRMDDYYYRSINIANNFFEVTFLLGGEEFSKTGNDFYKQIQYPISTKQFLDIAAIHRFLNHNNIRYLQQINLIGYHLTAYPDWQLMLETMPQYGIPVTYYFQGDETIAIEEICKYSTEKISLGLYFTDIESLRGIETLLANRKINHQWIFVLEKNSDWEQAQQIVDSYQIENYKMQPVLTGDAVNYAFFENNVFTSSEELTQLTPSKKNIFCNQTINSNYWGQLFVMPDRKVYANLNKAPLGSIEEDVLCLIRKEMIDADSCWRYTRDKFSPCKSCIYRYLCPPPSNYEFYLNRFNLCTVGNDNQK